MKLGKLKGFLRLKKFSSYKYNRRCQQTKIKKDGQ